MNNEKKGRGSFIAILVLVLVLGISIGYAALSTTLNINGSTTIGKSSWDVHFANCLVGTNTSGNYAQPSITDNGTKLTISKIGLSAGTEVEYYVDVVNAGTIDAMISEVINTSLEADTKKYLDYTVNYANGLSVAVKDQLKAGETVKMQVSVKYKTDLNASDLPTEDKPLDLSFRVTYIQADETSNAITSNPIMNSCLLYTSPSPRD